jgi:hypothetical protein
MFVWFFIITIPISLVETFNTVSQTWVSGLWIPESGKWFLQCYLNIISEILKICMLPLSLFPTGDHSRDSGLGICVWNYRTNGSREWRTLWESSHGRSAYGPMRWNWARFARLTPWIVGSFHTPGHSDERWLPVLRLEGWTRDNMVGQEREENDIREDSVLNQF